jgi:hypothetical protein
MMAILWDRLPTLGKIANVEIIPVEKAPKAHRLVDE